MTNTLLVNKINHSSLTIISYVVITYGAAAAMAAHSSSGSCQSSNAWDYSEAAASPSDGGIALKAAAGFPRFSTLTALFAATCRIDILTFGHCKLIKYVMKYKQRIPFNTSCTGI